MNAEARVALWYFVLGSYGSLCFILSAFLFTELVWKIKDRKRGRHRK